MSNYYPDKWILVKLTDLKQNTAIYKVLAGWIGGYAAANTWKLSSGITAITEEDNQYVITNESGSIYYCHKAGVGTTMLSQSIYNHFESELAKEPDMATIEVVDVKVVQELFKS